jgi:predicted phage terminase large subunit-like protein
MFMQSAADIVFYGGAAGGGKSYALLMEAARNVGRPGFDGVIFRKTFPEIKNAGGLWPTSMGIYPLVGGTPLESKLMWKWSSGATIQMSHMQHDSDMLRYQGSQYAFIGWDEVTHFSRAVFFYLLSRNRSTCGVSPYVRATCNPDPDSWVAEFIAWWLDKSTGLAIPERSGVLRWFISRGDDIVWGDSKEALIESEGYEVGRWAKSVSFIAAKLSDNPALTTADPSYEATLNSLTYVDRQRLLGGNWSVRPSAGMCFRREWFRIVDAIPAGTVFVRSWDRAGTIKTINSPDPDWTVGVKIGRCPDGRFIIADEVRIRQSPMHVDQAVRNTADQDGPEVQIVIQQDPGSAGISDASNLVRLLAGYQVLVHRPTLSKWVRAKPLSSQAEAGNVALLRGAWNSVFLEEAQAFVDEKLVKTPEGYHDDQIDAASVGFMSVANVSDPRIG